MKLVYLIFLLQNLRIQALVASAKRRTGQLNAASVKSLTEPSTKTTLVDRASARKRWGIDNEHKKEYIDMEYWFDSRIHTLGNT